MKSKLLIIAFSLGAIGLFGFVNSEKQKEDYCHYGQCSAVKKDGYSCRNCAQQGSYYCWSHRD